MDDIKLRIDGRDYCLSSNKLNVVDFGKTLDEAKQNFKKAVNLMLDTELAEIKKVPEEKPKKKGKVITSVENYDEEYIKKNL